MEVIAKSGLHPVAQRAGAHLGTVDGWRVVLGYGSVEAEQEAARERVALADVSAAGKLVIQGWGTDIDEALGAQLGAAPENPTDLVTFDGGWIAKTNRYEYYAVLPLDKVDGTVDALHVAFAEVHVHAHVTPVTHGRDAMAVLGPRAAEALSKVCGLDFHERVFPNHRAQISSLAKVKVTIARVDRGNLPCYEVHLDRTFSEYVWEVVLDAAGELGGMTIGLEALNKL
ncbi:MAG: sarcosine oxidase subunit gamma family protein [Candidatus Bipolaricaulia bacterium]